MAKDPKRVIDKLQREIGHDFNTMTKDLTANLKKETPVGETRNAQRGWRNIYRNDLFKRREFDVIENQVDYIGILDQGSSRQAPQGIVKPAVQRTRRIK